MFAEDFVLPTPRLIIRPALTTDVDAIMQLSTIHAHRNFEAGQLSRVFENYTGHNKAWLLGFDAERPDQVMLDINFVPRPHKGVWDIEYGLLRAYRKRGLMREAVRHVVPEFLKLAGVEKLTAQVHVKNYDSRGVLENCGFTRDRNPRTEDMLNYTYGGS